MAAVAKGPAACSGWRDRFAGWDLDAAVPQVVMNALDPLLLWVALGPDQAARWLPPLVRHYEALRADLPGPFSDVDRAWSEQRAWWRQYADPDLVAAGLTELERLVAGLAGAASSNSGGSGSAPDEVPDPRAIEASSPRRAARGRPAPSRGTFVDPPAPSAAASSTVSGAPHAVDSPPVRPAEAVDQPSSRPRPVRPPSPAPRPAPSAAPSRPPVPTRAGGYASSRQASLAAAPLAAPGRQGRASAGRRARELVDALGSPPVPYGKVRRVSDDLADEGHVSPRYDDWAFPHQLYEQGMRDRGRPQRTR